MIDCPNEAMRDLLPDLANESLESSVRVLVTGHIATCAACAAEIEIIRSARLLLVSSTPRVNVASIVKALPSYRGSIPIQSARSARNRTWGSSWRIAAAATFLAAGLGSFAVLRPGAPVVVKDTTVVAVNHGLALTGTLADLSDAELVALVKDIDGIEALPSTEVEAGSVVNASNILPDSIGRDLEIP
ncbi:MAG: hypothetical protein ABIR92_00565 [Gemmatimonadaceae bacterium]